MCNFIVECFQAPAGEVAEDDGEHGKNIIFCLLVVKIKTPLWAPILSAPNPKYYFRKNANLKLFQKQLNFFS